MRLEFPAMLPESSEPVPNDVWEASGEIHFVAVDGAAVGIKLSPDLTFGDLEDLKRTYGFNLGSLPTSSKEHLTLLVVQGLHLTSYVKPPHLCLLAMRGKRDISRVGFCTDEPAGSFLRPSSCSIRGSPGSALLASISGTRRGRTGAQTPWDVHGGFVICSLLQLP